MNARFLAVVCSVSMLAALGACQGKGKGNADPAANAVTKAPATPAADAKAPSGPVADGDPPKAPPVADGGPPTPDAKPPAPPSPADSKSLGAQFTDPGWFRKTMFGDKGKALDTKRSEADEQGRFSSFIRFELDGLDVGGCADHLEGLLKEAVPNLTREPLAEDRIQLKGNNERYRVTFQCGANKGKSIAYVSYEWT